MDKVKFVMGEIQTLAYDLNAIAADHTRWEERWATIEREREREDKEMATQQGHKIARPAMGRPMIEFGAELTNIRDRLNLIIEYLGYGGQARVDKCL